MFRPNDQIGPYTLICQLGRGAFGVVWLAEERSIEAGWSAMAGLPHRSMLL